MLLWFNFSKKWQYLSANMEKHYKKTINIAQFRQKSLTMQHVSQYVAR